MRTLLALVTALVLLTATPALAHASAHRAGIDHHAVAAADDEGGHGEYSDGDDALLRSEREGNDTDPIEFATVAVAGLALTAAVAALVFARVRPPV